MPSRRCSATWPRQGKLGSYVVERAFMEIGSPAGLAELEAHIRAQEGRQP